jgi:PleD family two-component response regulator
LRYFGIHITLSIGVAVAGLGNTMDFLLERSDLALYQAKNEGRNRVVLASAPVSAVSSGSEVTSA